MDPFDGRRIRYDGNKINGKRISQRPAANLPTSERPRRTANKPAMWASQSEGAGKPSQPDKRRFYAIAYGSIRETQTILRLLGEVELYDQADKLGAYTYKLMQATK